MLTEASSSEHDPKAKWNLVWMKKFSSNFTSFCRGQKGDVYTKNCIRKRKYYKQKVILRLKKCPICRGITDSVWVSATIIFCLIRVAFTFSLQHGHANQFSKKPKRWYSKCMKKNGITEYFEEVETEEEYNGYFCRIPDVITIVILGSMCGLRNISQIHQWAASDRVSSFLK